MTEKRTFWKTVKPFLADKTNKTSKTTLIEEERVISQDHRIAKLFNEYFISIPIKNMPKNMKYKSVVSSRLASSLFLFFRYLFTSISSHFFNKQARKNLAVIKEKAVKAANV